ncbi:MAG TPA: hypothetical protein V6C99_02440, partial [Oculatellaceae cyanobacterium]
AEIIYQSVDKDANIIFGSVIDERIQGEIQITVIATGFELKAHQAKMEQFGNAIQMPMPQMAGVASKAGVPASNLPLMPTGTPPKLEDSSLWKNRPSSGMSEAARKLLDLPDFLRPKK